MEDMFDTVRGLIREAKGRGDGYVVDHLDKAENWLNTIEGRLKLGFTWSGEAKHGCSDLSGRLASLHKHLSDEGWHVHANTVALLLDANSKSRMTTLTNL